MCWLALETIRGCAFGRSRSSLSSGNGTSAGTKEVQLPARQQQVLALYASGEKASTVARRMNLSVDTVNDYITRIRRKYAEIGRPAPTKMDLYKRALEDGWLPVPRYTVPG